MRTLLLLSVLVAACSSKSANGSPKDEPAPAKPPAAATPGQVSPAAAPGPTVASSDGVAAAIEAARKRATGMNIPKPAAGPRVTLLDIAATHDATVQTGEIWHRYLLGGHKMWETCWRDAIGRGVKAEGVVVVSARIAADGGLVDVKVEETIDPALGKCIAGRVDAIFLGVLAADAGAKLRFTAYFEVLE